jgi:putative membrane protein
MLVPLLIRIVINAIAIGVTAYFFPNIISFTGDNWVQSLLVIAIIFGLVNSIIKPIVAVLTCPLYILTLGLFTLVVNALMLLLTGWIADQLGLQVEVTPDFVQALLGALIISVVSFIVSLAIPDNLERGERAR